ncbi:MAG TPA: hypothetical protein VMY87_06395 [Armatimonadota bacterium]|nr:hypothetical protein [Armatimonadota bacterium]
MNFAIVGQRRDDATLPLPGSLAADGIPVSAACQGHASAGNGQIEVSNTGTIKQILRKA